MNYSAKELIDKLGEKVEGLGISPSFKENPAFSKAIGRIYSNISRMNMAHNAENVTVREEEGKISFQWTSTDRTKYSMEISCTKPEEFICTTTEEKAPRRLDDGKMAREKTIKEDIATIRPNGFIDLVTNGAMINDINCERNTCNSSTWSQRYQYISEGVMLDCEEKTFSEMKLFRDFDQVDANQSLFYPRDAFKAGRNNYQTRDLITRKHLDIAHVYSEDKSRGTKYVAYEKLSSQYGYQDLILQGGGHSKEIIIDPISKEEIERMIDSHPDPKVREGLRIYAKGREEYSYNSEEDPAFTYEGFEDSKERSR